MSIMQFRLNTEQKYDRLLADSIQMNCVTGSRQSYSCATYGYLVKK